MAHLNDPNKRLQVEFTVENQYQRGMLRVNVHLQYGETS